MSSSKTKINLRVGIQIHEQLLGAAEVEDTLVGTLTNRLIGEELEKVNRVGINNCYIKNSELLKKNREMKTIGDSDTIYVLPMNQEIFTFMTTRLDNQFYPQISFYFDENQMELLEQIVKLQRINKTMARGKIRSYRFAIGGLILNTPVCKNLLARNE